MKLLSRLLSGIALTGVLLTGPAIYFHRQNISDWWRLRGYTPSAEIVKLADESSMTPFARRLFYVQHPQLDDAQSFNQNCSGVEQTIVLGCYVSKKGIYIFRVVDKRLAGIHQVTAAHEMLHAAYDRHNKQEKDRIDKLTASVFKNSTDKRIIDVIASYKSKDTSVVPNELHSILATEMRVLPAELETYYSKYFIDRDIIVDYSEDYENAFSERQTLIASLLNQINSLEVSLQKQKISIDQILAELKVDSARLQQLKSSGRNNDYNAAVPPYNTNIQHYRQLVDAYNSGVRQLNNLVKQHNKIAIEQRQLVDAINSHSGGL